MRISVDKRDKGYRWDAYDAGKYKVTFNGEPITHVVTADEEEGIVKRFVLGEDGRVKTVGSSYQVETLQGEVKIEAKGADGESLRDPKVKVERNREGLIEVLVYSRIRPGTIRRTTLDEPTVSARGFSMSKAVSIFAGQAAEQLCARNGELYDPSDCAKMAMAEYERLMASERGSSLH